MRFGWFMMGAATILVLGVTYNQGWRTGASAGREEVQDRIVERYLAQIRTLEMSPSRIPDTLRRLLALRQAVRGEPLTSGQKDLVTGLAGQSVSNACIGYATYTRAAMQNNTLSADEFREFEEVVFVEDCLLPDAERAKLTGEMNRTRRRLFPTSPS